SQSAAFDEKFLYKRNEIQAKSIDSILKKGANLFVGVGAAHLPGERGVIEMLRVMGYTLRPIKMKTRDPQHKEAIEKIRVPVQFSKQASEDGFFTVNIPGKLYGFGPAFGGVNMKQYADMTNGSYYMVTRILTNAAILGHSEAQVERKIDSVLYENIPGKILSRKTIVRNGYRGFDISNRTRRGDHQRYNIFITPFEIIIFKMSGNANYVALGTEAEQFFSSIQLKELKQDAGANGWRKFRPSYGGFEVEVPHEPFLFQGANWQYAAYDAGSKTAFEIIRTDVHNHDFLEEDSFDLNLMEESFASSDFIQRQTGRRYLSANGYPVLDVAYKFKDSSVAQVRFLINGPRYYTLVAKAQQENKGMQQFINSFQVKPFVYGEAKTEKDTALFYSVKTPVPLFKTKKLEMFPAGLYSGGNQNNDDDSLIDNGTYLDRVIENDSTGERVFVSFYKPSSYHFVDDTKTLNSPEKDEDEDWILYKKKVDTLANKAIVSHYQHRSKASSRMLVTKAYEKDGIDYVLRAQADTVLGPGSFITTFFETFTPSDTLKGVDVKKKKTALFFAQLFSKDTMEHKKAIKNIYSVQMDSTDFTMLKKSIEQLSWKEKKYLELKKDFIGKLVFVPTKEASDFLRTIYYAAGDTVDLQYTALETLLGQATDYSYKTFAGIMENDPPVLDLQTGAASVRTTSYTRTSTTISPAENYDDYESGYNDGAFMNDLTDTVKLTAGIYKNLLPLINIDDYEQSVMELTSTLLDSNVISAKDYETYLPKFIIEAKQALKKQFIKEKTKAIEKAQKDEEEKQNANRNNREDSDYGNSRLNLYAGLILPFWDKHPQVQTIFNQLLSSSDKRLKYNTAYLLLRNKRPVPDTM
ncbi:MAG TPA: TraB/GumN family protein, partial [Flavisolibacter sp.]